MPVRDHEQRINVPRRSGLPDKQNGFLLPSGTR
jgi:hypothetical protein